MWPFSKRKESPRVFVLGTQLAAAKRVEEARWAKRNLPPNPITPDMAYDSSEGALDLTDLQHLPADQKLAELCHVYASSDITAREAISAGIPMDGLYTLISFAQRSAAFALQEKDIGAIQTGLTALSMADRDRVDSRDLLRALGLLYGVAGRNGLNADELITQVAQRAVASTRALMMGFVSRSAGDKDMGSMGFTTVQTAKGPAVVDCGCDRFAPTRAIDRVALALADLIRRDKYEPSITLAQNMPAVWLDRIDSRALSDALAKTVAGATVHGRLRPRECPDYQCQQLTVFLIELADEAAAGVLLNLAEAKIARKGEVAIVARRQGKLFCLAAARSFQQGKKSFETMESLSRLGPEIAVALLRQ